MVWKDNLCVNDIIEHFFDFLEGWFPLSFFKDPRDSIMKLITSESMKVPKHFMFANFQCLRCGLCCKNYESPDVIGDLKSALKKDGRHDVLPYISMIYVREDFPLGMIRSTVYGCSLARKVRNKPYYYCRIHKYIEFVPTCRRYLCSKSMPVAHLDYDTIDELIELIGLEAYYELIETDWGEDFDWSNAYVRTH